MFRLQRNKNTKEIMTMSLNIGKTILQRKLSEHFFSQMLQRWSMRKRKTETIHIDLYQYEQGRQATSTEKNLLSAGTSPWTERELLVSCFGLPVKQPL